MSGEPTSAADGLPADLEDYEGLDPRVLVAAGWTPEELYWEELSATALALAGKPEAEQYWREAARAAPEIFAEDDPRRATGLANLALVEPARAAELLSEAVALWQGSERWLLSLRPERRARSSLFHLRLQSKHRGGYDHWSHQRYRQLHGEGLQRLMARASGGLVEDEDYRTWRGKRPVTFDDARRLTAAVYLIAPNRKPSP
jgi:hypothetical protein